MAHPSMRLPDNTPGRSQSNGDAGGVAMNYNAEPDFSEFMWMAEEDLEAFDHKVISEVAQVMMQQTAVTNNSRLREDEEEFLRRMLEEEEQRETVYYSQYLEEKRRNNETAELESNMQKMVVSHDIAAKSDLNPNAREFVPNPNAREFVPAQGSSGGSNPPQLISHGNSHDKKSS